MAKQLTFSFDGPLKSYNHPFLKGGPGDPARHDAPFEVDKGAGKGMATIVQLIRNQDDGYPSYD